MSIERRYNPIDLLPDVAVGIKIPLIGTNGNLFDLSYSTEDQAISNLKNLILTRRGERVYQPLFGTTIQDSLFEQNTESLIASIRASIVDAVSFWLPYINLTELIITPVIATGVSRDEHGITISMKVAVNDTTANVPITFLVTPSSIEVI